MRLLLFIAFVVCLASPALAQTDRHAVNATEVNDYVFGNYRGEFTSPPSADGNPRRALIVAWKDFSYRLVFAHEASYCPFFELSDGSGVCYQFFEGNDGWAELFNQFGRMEQNSFVEVIDRGAKQVHVRWTYFGVNQQAGERAYRGVEDFWAMENGLVLRRQTIESLMPERHEGYAREPIELIGMCPVGKLWKDVLQSDEKTGERHSLAALDPYSEKRYDVFWTPKPGTLWQATPRRSGSAWKDLDDSNGIVLVIPMNAGSPFCIFGGASGFDPRLTRIKEHSHADTGGQGWISSSWDHWPIGWLNSQGHEVDEKSLQRYPNHFSPAGIDLFAMPDRESARGVYWSLCGVGGKDLEVVRKLARQWLEHGPTDPAIAAALPLLPP
jgi:hypothetical protein